MRRAIDSRRLKVTVGVFLPLVPLRNLLARHYAWLILHVIAAAGRGNRRCLLLELE